MIRIALCGNIASGKSEVQRFLERQGFKVLDTDKVSHELLTVKNNKLYEHFKDFDVFENGEFSREKFGRLVFADENLRKDLEKILHPRIAEKIKEFFNDNFSEKLTFVAIPLLYEAKMEYLFDKTIFVYADDNIRLERLIKRNHYDIEYAKKRLSSQIPQEEKIKSADYVLYNNGTKEELQKKVQEILKTLC